MLSGWERFQAWRNARKSAVGRFIADGQSASASLSTALIAQTRGHAELAAQAAIKRIANEAAAKVAQAQNTLDKLA
jgi:hypothetical protein